MELYFWTGVQNQMTAVVVLFEESVRSMEVFLAVELFVNSSSICPGGVQVLAALRVIRMKRMQCLKFKY